VISRYDGFSFNQGLSAELVAEKWALGRQQLDAFAAESHRRAAAAVSTGAFNGQLVPVDTGITTVSADEGIRPDTTSESLARLPPAFKEGGLVHAGNASQISDGAAALLVMTPERARELSLTPIARYHSGAVVGDDPVLMLTGPIAATRKLLHRAGLRIGDVQVYEVNEAFACVPLAWQASIAADSERLNPLGGAIALGHPLGASGAILTTRLIHHMRDRGMRYGLQAMCEGGGTANATLFELL
jgi:acetyl-CoA acyltransferase